MGIKKEDVKKYLEMKLSYFNREKIKKDGRAIKVFMGSALFDVLVEDMININKENVVIHGKVVNTITFGIYDDCSIWKRFDETECVLCFLDKFPQVTKEDITVYV